MSATPRPSQCPVVDVQDHHDPLVVLSQYVGRAPAAFHESEPPIELAGAVV